jgi:hypothetical protein
MMKVCWLTSTRTHNPGQVRPLAKDSFRVSTRLITPTLTLAVIAQP